MGKIFEINEIGEVIIKFNKKVEIPIHSSKLIQQFGYIKVKVSNLLNFDWRIKEINENEFKIILLINDCE